ncbi:MAG: FG-GAP-like repeat-containing protein [Candidatus Zixiibacteriota bacterium]
MRHILGLIIIPCVVGTINAETRFTKEVNPFAVTVSSQTLTYPFFGGLNDPKPNLIDFDLDGLTDLLISQAPGNLVYLKNTGTSIAPVWTSVDSRVGGLKLATFNTLVDIDLDLDWDIFSDAGTGYVRFWRNNGAGPHTFAFTEMDSQYGDFQVELNCTPAFVDLDGDGDDDFFYGNTGGNLVFWENSGTALSPIWNKVTDFYDSIIAFPSGPMAASVENPNHGFSNIRFVDIDSDADQDLFWGDIFNMNMYLFDNLGADTLSDLTLNTTNYLNAPTLGFNHPTFADLDGDSDLDLLIGVANFAEINNLCFYRNLGNQALASFSLETSNYLPNIDLGSSAVPCLADLDKDGDLDLLVGGGDGRLSLFRNTGTKSSPAMTLESNFFNGIDGGSAAAPEIVDYDNDGDLDMLLGIYSGRIQYYRNDGSVTVFNPVLFDTIDIPKVDQLATPRVADFNGDGLFDLVVGEWDFNSFANILLYKNVGAVGAPIFQLQTASLLNKVQREFTIPEIFDWNRDGKPDLVVGLRQSGLNIYLNTASTGVFPDSNTMLLSSDTLQVHDDGYRLAAQFADIDNDDDADIFVGEDDGGINFWRDTVGCCVGIRGNANGDPNESINIVDLTFLVQYLFLGGKVPPCRLEGSINGDATINVIDITYLVNYMFKGGVAPPACP